MPDIFRARGINRNDANSKSWIFETLKEMIWECVDFEQKLRKN